MGVCHSQGKARIIKEEQIIRKAFNKQNSHQGKISSEQLNNLITEIASKLNLKQPNEIEIENAKTQIDSFECEEINFTQFKKLVKIAFKDDQESIVEL